MRVHSFLSSLRKKVGSLLLFVLILAGGLSCEAASLVGHWRFNEDFDGKFPDQTGANPDGVFITTDGTRSPNLVVDDIGGVTKVTELVGSENGGVSLPISTLKDLPSFTIECWIKWNGPTEGAEMIFANSTGLVFNVREKGRVSAMLAYYPPGGGDGVWAYTELPEALPVGDWCHLMLRSENGSIQISAEIDGQVIHSETALNPGPARLNWATTAFGINPLDKSSPFSGRVAGVKIYDGAIDDAQFTESKP